MIPNFLDAAQIVFLTKCFFVFHALSSGRMLIIFLSTRGQWHIQKAVEPPAISLWGDVKEHR